ncbi:phage tail family protein [Streptomyces hirsutus]|uniref:Phage tail family protein n=1 Tax=Streptomyces hirsutus TaxID=35620 RepID=A0ABZ1GTS7_9ACTN|nr:phage tail family protein [Streptomyces hirsutus]WSD09320.1 phage tail family protein [Streptomyces hirsutus]
MPLLVGGSNTLPSGPGIPDVRATTVTWTSSSGRITSLSDFDDPRSGAFVMPGVAGTGLPDYAFYSDQSPAFDGSVVRGVRAGQRQITIPLHLWGPDRPSCLARYHRLVQDLNPAYGPGTLTFAESDGSARRISAYYMDGLTGQEDDDRTGRHWMTAVLVFMAPSPYWLGDDKTLTFHVGGGSGTFLPLLPLRVRDSQVLGAVKILNLGEVDTYPVWTIKGPATTATITNTTTGESFVLTRTLTSSDTAVIDTREGIKDVRLNGSTNLWPNLGSSPVLWPLRPGSNDVGLTVTGTSTASSVQLTYTSRYLTAF